MAPFCSGSGMMVDLNREASGEEGLPVRGTVPGEPRAPKSRPQMVWGDWSTSQREAGRRDMRLLDRHEALDSWTEKFEFILRSVGNHCNIFVLFWKNNP